MEEKTFGYSEFLIGLIVGIAGGLAIGVLTAPQAGMQTRRDIVDIATDIKDSTNELLEHTREGFEHATSRVERAMGISDKNIRKRLEEIRAQLDGYTPSETTP
ncbi:MAG: YtxH domain-containing protein [Chloroflexi bacterium]|nr:YtxH domain-containing protein [Chloroflexota bacterium]